MLLWFITSCPHPSWGILHIPDPKRLMGAKKQPKTPTKIMHVSWWFLLSPIVATKLKFGKSRSLPNAPKFFLLAILGDTKVPLNVRRNLKILRHSNRPSVQCNLCFTRGVNPSIITISLTDVQTKKFCG